MVISLVGVAKATPISIEPEINKDRMTRIQYLLKNLTVRTTNQAASDAGIITKIAAVRKLPK